jgi:hypothetical protein
MGRSNGSKNNSNHEAGGRRKGAGRPKTKKDAPAQQRLQQSTLRNAFCAPTTEEDELLVRAAIAEQQRKEVETDAEQAAATKQQEEAAAQRREEQRQRMLKKLREATADGSLDSVLECFPGGDGNDDNGDDSDDDEETTTPTSAKKKRKPYTYKPPKGSTLHTLLETVKNQVKSDSTTKSAVRTSVYERGQHWVIPEIQSPIMCRPTDPGPWYLEDQAVFVWLPFLQFPKQVSLKTCRCIHCNETGVIESKEYDWRPMLYFDRVVWVIHRRFRCQRCNRSFLSSDPTFLSTLPTRVSERFPFVTAGSRRLGVHKFMLYSFVELITSRVQFGTFANAMNTIYALKYDMSRLSYYSSFIDWKNQVGSLGADYPVPFAKFNSVGEFNGIKLTKGTMKALFINFMKVHEPYMQASFQTKSDEGTSADHTFKYAKVIQAAGRGGPVFGASYTTASLLGSVVLSRLVFTKSKREIYRETRDNAGQGPLKIFHSDNLNGDGSVWRKHFPELTDGVVPLVSLVDPSLPLADIEPNDYTFCATKDAADVWAQAAMNSLMPMIDTGAKILAGIDLEWIIGETETNLLQVLSLPDLPVGVFHLSAMEIDNDFPNSLKDLLELPNLRACGVQIGGDLSRLKALGVNIQSRIELQQLAAAHDKNQDGTSLSALCRRYLKKNVDKSGQNADYSQEPLPPELIKYGALDALLSRRLAETIAELVAAKGPAESVVDAPNSNTLAEGTQVNVLIGGKCAAAGKIVYVGGVNGESRMFGKLLVSNQKAIVRLTEVHVRGLKPPFRKSQDVWPKNVTIGWVFLNSPDRDMAVKTSNLAVPVKDGNSTIPEYFGNMLAGSNATKSHDSSKKTLTK